MANEEHVALLRRGVESWGAWRRERRVRPDLRGADLRGLDLRSANLFNAALDGANLEEATLVDAKLSKQDIRDLSRAAGLPTADLPASACLSSRLVYGLGVMSRFKKI